MDLLSLQRRMVELTLLRKQRSQYVIGKCIVPPIQAVLDCAARHKFMYGREE